MIIRIKKTQDFTVMANFALRDNNLSLKAKGLWAYLMTKPDSWDITYRSLSAELKEGQAAILAALKELEEANYLIRGEKRLTDGKFGQGESTLHERPCVENSRVDSSRTIVNTIKTNTNTLAKANVAKSAAREKEVLALVSSLTGRSFRVLPRGSAKTLKAFTNDEIKTALERLMEDEWHENKIKELSSDYLLRPTTIDKFLTMGPVSRGYA